MTDVMKIGDQGSHIQSFVYCQYCNKMRYGVGLVMIEFNSDVNCSQQCFSMMNTLLILQHMVYKCLV